MVDLAFILSHQSLDSRLNSCRMRLDDFAGQIGWWRILYLDQILHIFLNEGSNGQRLAWSLICYLYFGVSLGEESRWKIWRKQQLSLVERR